VSVSSEGGGDGGGAVSDCDSQRSSMSFEEGTYDGRQGSVTYSCQDDEQMMKSSSSSSSSSAAGAVMYDERCQQPYVITVSLMYQQFAYVYCTLFITDSICLVIVSFCSHFQPQLPFFYVSVIHRWTFLGLCSLQKYFVKRLRFIFKRKSVK